MTIEESDIGKRLDVFTSERMSVTRSAAQKLIEDGFVTVNDKKPAKNYRLKAGDEFDCELPEPVPRTPSRRTYRSTSSMRTPTCLLSTNRAAWSSIPPPEARITRS